MFYVNQCSREVAGGAAGGLIAPERTRHTLPSAFLLLKLGFEERTRGSHHVFRHDGIEERINLQRDGSNAKPYQVRQVRTILVRHNLETGE